MYLHVYWLESNYFLLEKDEGPTRYHWLSMLALSSGGFAICFILWILLQSFVYSGMHPYHYVIFLLFWRVKLLIIAMCFFNSKYYNIIFFSKNVYAICIWSRNRWNMTTRTFFLPKHGNKIVFSVQLCVS